MADDPFDQLRQAARSAYPGTIKMFHIYENDLQKLEAALPRIMDAAGEALNNPKVQVLFDEVKDILSNVRWDYGPPTEVYTVPAGPPRDDDDGKVPSR